MIMMPSCPYFIFYRHLYLQTCGHIFWFRLSLEDKRGLSLGELIRPFCIMLLYRYLLHYGLLLYIMSQYLCLFSLILQVYIKRENAGSWDSGLEKEQILETYYAQLQKSWNFTEDVFIIYKKYWAQEVHQGGHTLSTRVGGVPYPPGRAPYLVGPLVALQWSSSAIWSLSMKKKS